MCARPADTRNLTADASYAVTEHSPLPASPISGKKLPCRRIPGMASLCFFGAIVLVLASGCKGGGGLVPDSTPPANIVNLDVAATGATVITLNWVAPGDDANSGIASSYDLRISKASIDDANFAAALRVSGTPVPATAGHSQTMTVTGLEPQTSYYIAMKAADEVPNTSGLSNVVQATTNGVDPPPGSQMSATIDGIAWSAEAYPGSDVQPVALEVFVGGADTTMILAGIHMLNATSTQNTQVNFVLTGAPRIASFVLGPIPGPGTASNRAYAWHTVVTPSRNGIWQTDEARTGVLAILSVDNVAHTASGTFSFSAHNALDGTNASVVNGTFHAPIFVIPVGSVQTSSASHRWFEPRPALAGREVQR